MNLVHPQTKGERTRAHIVQTAAGLFWRRSFHGVAIDDIARAAGINKATVYRYFADKSDLSLAVVRHHGELALRDVFGANFARHTRPQIRLASIYHDIYCAHSQVKKESGDLYGCPIMGLALELGQDLPAIRTEARRIFAKLQEHLRMIARDALAERDGAGSPETLARTLAQLLHGGFASARLSADPNCILDAGNASLALIGFPNTPILKTEQAA